MAKMTVRQYLFNVGFAATRLFNTLIAGSPDETTSSRAHRAREKGHKYWGWTANAIDALFFWDADHCRVSHENDLRRARQNLKTWNPRPQRKQ